MYQWFSKFTKCFRNMMKIFEMHQEYLERPQEFLNYSKNFCKHCQFLGLNAIKNFWKHQRLKFLEAFRTSKLYQEFPKWKNIFESTEYFFWNCLKTDLLLKCPENFSKATKVTENTKNVYNIKDFANKVLKLKIIEILWAANFWKSHLFLLVKSTQNFWKNQRSLQFSENFWKYGKFQKCTEGFELPENFL